MANWAYTHVNVEGNDLNKVKELHDLLQAYSEDNSKGHSPLEESKNKWDHTFLFDVQMMQE